MKWRDTTLGAVADLLSGGTPSKNRSEYWDGEIPWVSAKDLKCNYISESELHLTELGAANGTKVVPANTILFVVRGMSLANEFRISLSKVPVAFNQDLKALKITGDVDPAFLFYALFSKREEIRQRTGEAAHGTKKLETEVAKAIELRIPCSSTDQTRIASIVEAYDLLIVNNQRRIELLEQSARLLYREWFVRLKYPGYEHDKVVDGVPAGWRVGKLRDFCDSVDYGYTASAQPHGPGVRFLRITDIVSTVIAWDAVPFCEISEAKQRRFQLIEGDIVIARTGATVGYAKRMNKRHPEAVFASYLVRLRPASHDVSVLMGVFVTSEEYKKYVLSNVGGAAQPNANAQVLSHCAFILPAESVLREFVGLVDPILDQIEILSLQNAQLRKARDLLLPRLMGGRISL